MPLKIEMVRRAPVPVHALHTHIVIVDDACLNGKKNNHSNAMMPWIANNE